MCFTNHVALFSVDNWLGLSAALFIATVFVMRLKLGLFIRSKMYLESTNEGHEHAEVDAEDAKEETNVADANGEEQYGEARALADVEKENSFTHEEDEELNYNEEDEDYEGVTGD